MLLNVWFAVVARLFGHGSVLVLFPFWWRFLLVAFVFCLSRSVRKACSVSYVQTAEYPSKKNTANMKVCWRSSALDLYMFYTQLLAMPLFLGLDQIALPTSL